MVRERTPASRLASGLMPTASTSVPSAVRRLTSATSAYTAAATTTVRGTVNRALPLILPSCTRIEKKLGVTARLSSSSATSGQIGLRRNSRTGFSPGRDQLHHVVGVHVRPRQLPDGPAVAQHQHPVGQADHLVQL